MSITQWNLDASHSELRFKVKHLGISSVSGSFEVISGSLSSVDDSFQNADISFSADATSISTNNADRDNHLKSADFFEAEKFPSLTFEAKGIDLTKDEVEGILTIKGTSLPVKLAVEFEGAAKDPWGNEKAGFSVSGKIKRSAWGLTWNAALETGGVLVSDEVKISAEVQFTKGD
jgi:polyisoprenoid-binding protein YceI